MIDLRKPLEGVPGLLLLAVLILFGAIIGISLALLFSLMEMNESLLTFLGGVIGAGLGAAVAVLGAVYVQERQRLAALVGPAVEVRWAVENLWTHARMFTSAHDWFRAPDKASREFGQELFLGRVVGLQEAVDAVPEALEMPDVHRWIDITKIEIKRNLRPILRQNISVDVVMPDQQHESIRQLAYEIFRNVEKLQDELEVLIGSSIKHATPLSRSSKR